jgi:signal recognition particle receptor subunit beta
VTARIVFWGAEGAGKTTSLHAIHGKLKADHRGDLKRIPTRLDPTVTFEEFTIQLGSVGGSPTELRVVAVPGSPELAPTRKQLLDQVDGIVLVLDARAERLGDNMVAVGELRESLTAYGRTLEEIPVVVLYNKRDLGDPYTIDEMHRRLRLPEAAVFETVATEATGILQALTTISKRVVRVLREQSRSGAAVPPALRESPAPAAVPPSQASAAAGPAAAAPSPAPARTAPDPRAARAAMEEAILAEGTGAAHTAGDPVADAQSALDRPWPDVAHELKASPGARIGADMKVLSVGAASRAGDRAVRVPVVLGNDDGETVTLALTLSLEPLLDDDGTA